MALTHTQEKKLSINPYELRQSLLGQAQSILEMKYHAELETAQRNNKPITSKPPTTEEIIAEAKKLYDFVQTK